MSRFARGVAAAFLLLTAHTQWAQGPDYVRSRYHKAEYEVPMRDGTRLFTAVYAPKDSNRMYPIMLTRTPYGIAPYGRDNYPSSLGPSDRFGQDGFIFAYQDVRGQGRSGGVFVNVRPLGGVDESTDAYDTIEWLLRNVPNQNGRVGMWGISYPGFYVAEALVNAHPALKAASPQAPIADWFIGDDFHHNGAFFFAHAFNFLVQFAQSGPSQGGTPGPRFEHGTPDGYSFFLNMGPLPNANAKHLHDRVGFWHDLMEHGTYDAFWQARNLRPRLKGIETAVMTVGGWFDAEDLFGALNIYRSIEDSNRGIFNVLVMGPWYHGAWSRSDADSLGKVNFGSRTGVFYRDEIEFPFFRHFLKGSAPLKLPEAYVFETGRNDWKRYETWPTRNVETRDLYLEAAGKLSFDPPVSGSGSYDEYVSDPAKPVPFINEIDIGMTREYMVGDQRFAARRPDVLVYQTEPLTRDITLAGPVTPVLHVSTSGTDSDWVVKLVDVYPEHTSDTDARISTTMAGYQQLVRGEPMRGKFRNSFSKPEPFVPDRVTKVEFTMPDVNHTFLRGHRIMVHIQSSWFPLVDRNPQQFVDIYKANESDFRKAVQRVYHSGDTSSRVRVQIVP